jgi:hypothetical protein
MSELNNYVPKIKLTLGDKILETTRNMVSNLSKFDAVGSIEHNGNTKEVYKAIQEDLYDFQCYLGATDGDDATHYFCDKEARLIADVSALDDVYGQISQARWLLGSDADKVQINECLHEWIDHLYKYAKAIEQYGIRLYDVSSFKLVNGKHPFPHMQSLLEEHLGLRIDEDDNGLFYVAYDGRGMEYGDWRFCPKVIEHERYSQGIPIKLDDGSYKKDKWGKIVYTEYTQFTEREYVIEVTKFATDPDSITTIDVPFGSFYGFYREIANQ